VHDWCFFLLTFCLSQDLRAKADLMERRLLAAERLIAGLGSEKERWAADIKALEAAREQLVGDCLLCSSFLSYTGKIARAHGTRVMICAACSCLALFNFASYGAALQSTCLLHARMH
jgi:hypothetical protein